MQVAVTGGTGFIGRYIVRSLVGAGHACRCWHREGADRTGFDGVTGNIEWLAGELGDRDATRRLVQGRDAVIHAALYHPGGGFRGGEGDLLEFAERNVMGSLELIEAASSSGVGRFVFISSCAVHERILDDRPLDEKHPTWATSHYGAYKGAVEQFVHSYGWGQQYPICALRPTGVYGVNHPVEQSKWFDLVRAVVRGEEVTCRRGGKEVHAADVAKAALQLLTAPNIAGEAFNCYDRYISEYEVATIAKELSGTRSLIRGEIPTPKHQIVTDKLRAIGMHFGGVALLRQTVQELVSAVR